LFYGYKYIYRNQGLGSLLIKRMLDDIKSLGYRHISLSVSKDNYAAGWYRKLGFKVYKEQKEDYIMIVDL
jgi:ribosomal protein S18 acetylase RimI-like enzyme